MDVLHLPYIEWVSLIPIWLVFTGGVMAASVFWKQCPRASLLTLFAVVLLGIAVGAQPLVTHLLVKARATEGWTIQQLGFRLLGLKAIFNLLHALGYALLIMAVFLGRRPGARAGAFTSPILPPTL